MQIQPIQIRPVTVSRNRPVAMASAPLFGYEPKDPKKPSWGNKFDDFKRKITPGFESRQDLKEIGIGTGVIIAGQIGAGLIPVVGPALAVVTMFGGGWFAAGALIRMLTRKS